MYRELSVLQLLGLVQFSSQKEKKTIVQMFSHFILKKFLWLNRQQTPIKWECFPQTTLIKKAQILFAVLLV